MARKQMNTKKVDKTEKQLTVEEVIKTTEKTDLAAKLQTAEDRLSALAATDRNAWVNFFLIMEEVEQGQYWKGEYHSFSQWLNSFAAAKKIHVSVLWQRFKAGRWYRQYERDQAASGKAVVPLQGVTTPAETIDKVIKIAGGDGGRAAELMDLAAAGELSRERAQRIWKAEKAARKAAGLPEVKKSRHTTDFAAPSEENAEVSDNNSIDDRVKENQIEAMTAERIVDAFSRCNDWLPNIVEDNRFHRNRYGIQTEFPVTTAATRKARRIDVLVVENCTLKSKTEAVRLHGIEVKVSNSNLKSDRKMAEYARFVDFFWIAIPDDPDLIAAAQKYAAPKKSGPAWGVLAVGADGAIRVVVPAEEQQPDLRDRTLSTIALRAATHLVDHRGWGNK